MDTQPNANTLTVIEALTLEATPAASVDVLQNPIPDYMDDEGYALSNSANPPSITGARYRQYYMDRLGDCYDAIYDAFRAEPNFGGISSQETAGAITASPGFDHTTYRDELMHLIKRASIAAKNHIFMFYQNYAGDPTPGDANLDLIAGWMRAYHNVYLCAPNLNSKTSVMGRVYGRYNLYPSIIKQHCAVQGNDYSSSSNGGNTLEQIYDIANGTNISATGTWLNDAMGQGTTNLINGIPWTTATGEYDYDPDAVAIIDANAGPFR